MSLKLFTPPEDGSGITALPEQPPDKCLELRNALDSTVHQLDTLMLRMASQLQALQDCESQGRRSDGLRSEHPVMSMVESFRAVIQQFRIKQQAASE